MYFIFCFGHIELRNVLQSEQRGSFEQPPLHGAGHSNIYFHGHMENYSDKICLTKKNLKT